MDTVLINFIKKHESLLSTIDNNDASNYFTTLQKVNDLSKCLKNEFYEKCEQEIGHSFLKEYKRLIDRAQECVINGFYFKLEKEKMILFGPDNYASMHELITATELIESMLYEDLSEDQKKIATLFISDSNSIYLINFAIALTKESF